MLDEIVTPEVVVDALLYPGELGAEVMTVAVARVMEEGTEGPFFNAVREAAEGREDA